MSTICFSAVTTRRQNPKSPSISCASLGWKAANVIDLGDITAARGTEMLLQLWLRLLNVVGNAHFNINVIRGPLKA